MMFGTRISHFRQLLRRDRGPHRFAARLKFFVAVLPGLNLGHQLDGAEGDGRQRVTQAAGTRLLQLVGGGTQNGESFVRVVGPQLVNQARDKTLLLLEVLRDKNHHQ